MRASAYDPVIAAQMDAEDEEKNKPGGEYDLEIREALLAAGFPYEEGDLVPEPYENIEPEPCLSIASVTLQLDTEVILGFRDSFTDDVGTSSISWMNANLCQVATARTTRPASLASY